MRPRPITIISWFFIIFGSIALLSGVLPFRDLMSHWKACLGDGLVEMSLEGLIRNPEDEIRRLLAACGLPFEEGCLKPHEARGGVSTASAVQVRNPINSQGVGAWKKYETQLAPLYARLHDLGFVERP